MPPRQTGKVAAATSVRRQGFIVVQTLKEFPKGVQMRKLHFVALFALLATVALIMPPASSAQLVVGVSVRVGPPPLRVYDQPICPGPDYLWTPGYWAYGPAGYYWVPGDWVRPPRVGFLWTPGYWGFDEGFYRWHAGYWGPHVGFYGGINYGFGYFGTGFAGGRWDHDHFRYNTAVWRVNTRVIHTTYVDRTYVRDVHVNRVSYNGGRGGIEARPSREEIGYEHERHFDRTPMQARHDEGFRGGNGHSFQPPNRGERNDMARPNDRGNHANGGNGGEARLNDRGNGGGNRGERMNNAHGREGGPKAQGKPNGGPRHEGKPDHQRR